MARKGVEYKSRRHAVLPGYQLLFNKKALRENLPKDIGFASIVESPGEAVEGILYDIVDEHLGRLDESERYPDHYDRIEIIIEVEGEDLPCFVYKAQPDKVAFGLKPSRNYLNHILSAKDFLSVQYYNALDRSQTYEDDCHCCGKLNEVIFIKEKTSLFMVCQPCREARLVWGDALGRRLTVTESREVMQKLVMGKEGYSSISELIAAAVEKELIHS